MKATAIAPANVGLIKYWGRKNEELRLPENGSISLNLSNLKTTTSVEFSKKYHKDEFIFMPDVILGRREATTPESDSGQARMTMQDNKEEQRVIKHVDRIRKRAKMNTRVKVVSQNNFPSSTGLSSSSSGFAALTLAGAAAAGLSLVEKNLSVLARQGSGSACRSIPDGFVEWISGADSEASYATSIFPASYWDIVDIVAVVSEGIKEVSSAEGQKAVNSSPFYQTRLSRISEKIKLIKQFVKEKNFTSFGELIEAEALELHAIMLTSKPSLIYWTPGTLKIMKTVKKWRSEGLPVYFTINTGQDIHLFCESENEKRLVSELKKIPEVKDIIINYPSIGARLSDKHLF